MSVNCQLKQKAWIRPDIQEIIEYI